MPPGPLIFELRLSALQSRAITQMRGELFDHRDDEAFDLT